MGTAVVRSLLGGKRHVLDVRGRIRNLRLDRKVNRVRDHQASNGGKAKIYVDGRKVAELELRSSRTRYQVVAWQATWETAASRTVRVVVDEVEDDSSVDLDAFAVLE